MQSWRRGCGLGASPGVAGPALSLIIGSACVFIDRENKRNSLSASNWKNANQMELERAALDLQRDTALGTLQGIADQLDSGSPSEQQVA